MQHLESIYIFNEHNMIKTAERIELWIHYSNGKEASAGTPSSQTFEYLGFISLSDNESTKYKSRELQSVAVGPRCGTHLKLRFGAAHENPLNPHKQVDLHLLT